MSQLPKYEHNFDPKIFSEVLEVVVPLMWGRSAVEVKMSGGSVFVGGQHTTMPTLTSVLVGQCMHDLSKTHNFETYCGSDDDYRVAKVRCWHRGRGAKWPGKGFVSMGSPWLWLEVFRAYAFLRGGYVHLKDINDAARKMYVEI